MSAFIQSIKRKISGSEIKIEGKGVGDHSQRISNETIFVVVGKCLYYELPIGFCASSKKSISIMCSIYLCACVFAVFDCMCFCCFHFIFINAKCLITHYGVFHFQINKLMHPFCS